MFELRIAECCGNCVHSSRPKKPDDHATHYDVAKTERWCFFHERHITRECVCNSFEQDNKRGGVPACKRVFAFNNKLALYNKTLLRIREKYGEHVKGIDVPTEMSVRCNTIVIQDNLLGLKGGWYTSWIRVKDKDALKDLEFINKVLDFKESQDD